QLLPRLARHRQTDHVDPQVYPVLGQVLGDLARVRVTGRLTVGDQHDRPDTFAAEVFGGLAQGVRDRGLAVGLVLVDLTQQGVPVVGAGLHDDLAVLTTTGIGAGEHL